MDNTINLLPDNIANQIAAGEVIQRPASVIKELVENAMDAGATEIIIEIKHAGKTLIQVIDNGKGMAPMDARMAFERHATSKIHTADDLFALTTMGFRGEALASIAAVAQVVLQTRQEDAEMGTRIELEASKVTASQPIVCSKGANFAVKNLFFNVPARRKFLKADDTEFKHIITEVQRIAIVHPQVSFALSHNEQLTFKLTPTSQKQRIVDLFGRRLIDSLLTLDADTPLAHITGYVGRASASRKRGALQHFFVNGRYMRHPYFHRTVLNAYESMIPAGEQPEYFIFLNVDPSSIDVNIHPTKTEIKFEAESDIGKILYSMVREVLMKGAAVPSIDFDETNPIDLPTFVPLDIVDMEIPPIISPAKPPLPTEAYVPLDTAELPEQFRLPDMSDWSSFYETFEAGRSRTERVRTVPSSITKKEVIVPSRIIEPTPIVEERNTPSSIVLCGEYAIVSEGGEIRIVHLRRARMKIIYEEYMGMLKKDTILPNRLIFPELIDLGVKEANLLESHLDALHTLGFEISDMGGGTYAINGIPCGLKAGNESELLLDIIEECAACERSTEEVVRHRLVSRLTMLRLQSERLTPGTEMASAIVAELSVLPDNTVAPDGKTIVSIVTAKELTKRFA